MAGSMIFPAKGHIGLQRSVDTRLSSWSWEAKEGRLGSQKLGHRRSWLRSEAWAHGTPSGTRRTKLPGHHHPAAAARKPAARPGGEKKRKRGRGCPKNGGWGLRGAGRWMAGSKSKQIEHKTLYPLTHRFLFFCFNPPSPRTNSNVKPCNAFSFGGNPRLSLVFKAISPEFWP